MSDNINCTTTPIMYEHNDYFNDKELNIKNNDININNT